MALLEINLRKPALVEEVVDEVPDGGSTLGRASRGMGSRRQGDGGSMVRKLAMFGMVLALVGAVRAIQGRRSGASVEQEGIEVPIEDGSSEGPNGRRRILGIVLVVAGAAMAARRLRNSQRR